MNDKQTAKDRLETGYHVLQTVLFYRFRTGSPGLGWGVERAVVDRELDELEADLKANPPVPQRSGWRGPLPQSIDPLPLPSLRPYLKNGLRPLMNPRDAEVDDPGSTNT